jgi:DNA-binding beta-propeller fold protein YncE
MHEIVSAKGTRMIRFIGVESQAGDSTPGCHDLEGATMGALIMSNVDITRSRAQKRRPRISLTHDSVAVTLRQLQSCLALLFIGTAALPFVTTSPAAQTMGALPLELEAKIPLGEVKGRIDHLAYDPKRHRIFIAELGNGTVGVVEPEGRKVAHVISGLKEPQGVAYVPSTDTLYVANGGDGSVRLCQAGDCAAAGRIDLGDDADNIRVDTAANRVFVGYGSGGLAVIDPAARRKITEIPLRAHPESFQLARSSGRIFVNLPKKREIAIVDRAAGKQIATWPMTSGGNFPMALDEQTQRVLVAFRGPSGLGVLSMSEGARVASVETCGDADDIFVDAKRHRVYLSCGEGFLDVFDAQGDTYRRVAHIPTASGARTSLFIPDLDRLFLAVPATSGQPAEIWVFRPRG